MRERLLRCGVSFGRARLGRVHDHAQMTAVAASHAIYELISAMAPRG
ncbi:MAG: hypothetical protein WC580_09430 [Agrococcus sp.]